jgi:hypothetical protein
LRNRDQLATARAARGPPFDPLLFSHALYPGADAEKLREEANTKRSTNSCTILLKEALILAQCYY